METIQIHLHRRIRTLGDEDVWGTLAFWMRLIEHKQMLTILLKLLDIYW